MTEMPRVDQKRMAERGVNDFRTGFIYRPRYVRVTFVLRPRSVSNRCFGAGGSGEAIVGLIFGEHVLDLDRRELHRAGQPVALPP
jgi:hypothetical protein